MNGTLSLKADLEKLPEMFWREAEATAKAEGKYKTLEEMKKTIFSDAKNAAAFDNLEKKMTEAQLERIAYSSDLYRNHIKDLCVAREDYLQAKARLDAVNIKIDCTRSENSRTVAKMNLK